MKIKILLFIWEKITKALYYQGIGWPWMQDQVEKIASNENYKISMRRK